MADELTLTIRVHDPKEKRDPSMSACWVTVRIPRVDVQGLAALTVDAFLEKYVVPALGGIKNLGLASAGTAPSS
jgi:hypothetical protein